MLNNLAIIQILLPLASGLILFILPKRISWLFSAVSIFFTSLITIVLFKFSLEGTVITYHLGGWSSLMGIEYKLDRLSTFFMLIISSASFFIILAMRNLISNELNQEKIPLFFGVFLIAIAGLLGLCVSNDIFNIYVMLEVNAIASYALVGAAKKDGSPKAAFDYLIFGTIGSTMILFGIGFVYALVGSLNLTDISRDMPMLLNNNAARAGVGLMIFGILMKAALFPLSKWLVDIYRGAPSFVSAMLAATSNKVGIYLLVRFFFDVFKVNQYLFDYLNITLLMLAAFAIFACAILAYKQTNIKKFLAYSSLSQIGFIIFSVAIASNFAISGLLIYCFTHALEKTMLFLAAGYLAVCAGNENIVSFAGLRKSHPWICILITVNLLSNIGVPMTAGFVGKWQLFRAALETDLWYILIILLATLFSFAYVFKFVELMIFEKQKGEVLPVIKDRSCISILSIITIINIYIGINNQYLLDVVHQISYSILK
ncbi:MAG: proton-conducting transporter membrane subunit [Rickettsiales bacterium]|jgi:multicomponent Na+:H+ antiporter subunit D|nr:proton-conducting transporter membrane subunit [Rickettsiales bacterium]